MTQIAFTGNITSPIEIRFTQSGKAVGNVTVAVNRKKGDVEETDFYRVSLWESLAENAASLDKGTRVIVIGRQVQRQFETKDGEKRSSWEVTADSFGPDLRWATAQVARTGSARGQGDANTAPGDSGTSSELPGAYSADSGNWGSSDETPF